MDTNLSIKFSNIPLNEIKKQFHLDAICPPQTAQKENIALSIKLLYFYCDMLKTKYPSDIESLLCREIIILSYSILDGIVGCLGFLMQSQCGRCSRRCNYYSQTMFSGDSIRENEQKSFVLADNFLQKCKIINLTEKAKRFYNDYRQHRNNIHLTKNCNVITSDSYFSRKSCNQAVLFLSEFIDMIYCNHKEFVAKNRCCKK